MPAASRRIAAFLPAGLGLLDFARENTRHYVAMFESGVSINPDRPALQQNPPPARWALWKAVRAACHAYSCKPPPAAAEFAAK